MSVTPSAMAELGSLAPNFDLPNVIGNENIQINKLPQNQAMVVMFICNHCPYVIYIRDKMIEVANKYLKKGVNFIAISSNDVENYPDDSPEKMRQLAKEFNFKFPYLYDESQEVAKAYRATCTPDFFIYNKNLKLAYRGQFDDARPGNQKPITGQDLSLALDALLNNNQVAALQKPSIGCNIKWK